MSTFRVCLIGAGFISEVHAQAINDNPKTTLAAIVDINTSSAETLAKQFNAPHVFSSIEDMVEAKVADVCHVLLPPPLHGPIVKQLISAGLDVLVEKPVTVNSEEAFELSQLAKSQKRILGVNHNALWFPAFQTLFNCVKSKNLGELKRVDCVFMAPLRQLQARQFSHWMFAEPGNILLEQAVHPLSQIQALIGEVNKVSAIRGEEIILPNGQAFYPSLSTSLIGETAPAQFTFEVGCEFPVWRVRAYCEDGVIEADLVTGQTSVSKKSRYLDAMDHWLLALRVSGQSFYQGSKNLFNYVAALSGFKKRSDTFYLGIKNSIDDFYLQLSKNELPLTDAVFAGNLVRLCETLSKQVFDAETSIKVRETKEEESFDVLLLGGTGFIGKHLLNQLLAKGYSVGVMARNMGQLDDCYYQDKVTLIKGNITSADDTDKAIARTQYVVNLAHGGASGSYDVIYKAMVGGAEQVARGCLKHNVKQMIHIGSIAGLYLGDDSPAITAETPVDPERHERGEYARAKAEADLKLMDMHKNESLPVVLIRPGVVVGDGGIPFHSGIGFFNNSQHCIGWNQGANNLPFVLVEDVASSIVACIEKEVVGKTYNIVGDVPFTAKEYIKVLGETLGRPLKFHSQSISGLYGVEWFKWLVKKVAGRNVPKPSLRDFKSRGMFTPFDCSHEKKDLDWTPVSSRTEFIERGIHCYKNNS